MLQFFQFFANLIFYIYRMLDTTFLFQVSGLNGIQVYNISIMDLLFGLVCMSILIGVFWRGAKG